MRRVAMVLATVGLIADGMAATPRGHMTAGGGIPSDGKAVGANTTGASANGAVIGGASTTGTGPPTIMATAPIPRR
jgi:hypothetical protein